MYEQYFHFSELPFSIAPDPHFVYMSRRHQEGLAHLFYGIAYGGGFVALTGEVGTGKTTLCQCLLQELPSHVDLALILNPKQNAIELLANICDELGVAYDKQAQTLKALVDVLNHALLARHAAGRRTVLLLDEAQNLSLEVLEQLRLLTNLETSKSKLLQIILVGQPELNGMLKRQELRQLNQRITARYHLQPLSLNETRAYIRHRLHVCGGDPGVFKEQAIRKIYRCSGGIPRVINILCDSALLGAYAGNVRRVTARMVGTAARETLALPAKPLPKLQIAIGAGLLAIAAIAGYWFLHRPAPTINPAPALEDAGRKPLVPQAQALPEQAVPFIEWLADPRNSLPSMMTQALGLLHKTPPAGAVDCETIKTAGAVCQFGQASWRELLAMRRPAVLEFVLANQEKRYALLTGVKHDEAVLRASAERQFPLADVLAHWNGYYLIVWEPPMGNPQSIFPGQSSASVVWLRRQMAAFDGLNPPARMPEKFDQALKARVIAFQREHHLSADGVAGIQTLFFLDNLTEAANRPHLDISD